MAEIIEYCIKGFFFGFAAWFGWYVARFVYDHFDWGVFLVGIGVLFVILVIGAWNSTPKAK